MAVVAEISFTAAIQTEGREKVLPKKTNLITSDKHVSQSLKYS